MKVLFLTSVLPFQKRNGGEVCTSRLILQLCSMVESVLVVGRGVQPLLAPRENLEISSLGPQTKEMSSMSAIEKVLSFTKSVHAGKPWTVFRMQYGVMTRLRSIVHGREFDCIFVDHLQVYPWYEAIGHGTPAVLVAHNVEAQIYVELLRKHKGVAVKWVLNREINLLSKLDERLLKSIKSIACLAESDKDYYVKVSRMLGVSPKVEVLPSFYDDANVVFANSEKSHNVITRAKRIGILGTWTWESNRLGILWFFENVVALLEGECEIIVAGGGLADTSVPPPVKYLGYVESVDEFMASIDIIAIPSIYGSGIQEKTIQAIGYGKPVVATETAMRGISPVPPNVVVASTAECFADACKQIQVYNDFEIGTVLLNWNEMRRDKYRFALDSLLSVCRT